MKKKRVLIGTGEKMIDEGLLGLLSEIEAIEIIDTFAYFREGVSDTLRDENVDVFITSDYLEGSSLTKESFIKLLRSSNPETRIIYLLRSDDNSLDFKRFLFSLSVLDVLEIDSKIDSKEIISMIKKKREWKDVSSHFKDLSVEDIYSINEEAFRAKIKDIDLDPNDFESFSFLKEKSEDIISQTAAFWSLRAQSGSTFLATNTSLLLSQNKDLRILLVDLNLENPNVHLQMSLKDDTGDKNFSALVQDLEDSKLEKYKDFNKYLFRHPYHANFDILIGSIIEDFYLDQDSYDNVIDFIFEASKRLGYTSTIFDLSPGLNSLFVKKVLDRTDKVILPFLETPGSIITFQKFFSSYGELLQSMIDVNKLFPVMNQTTNSDLTYNFSELASSNIHRSVYAHILRSDKIHRSVANGIPLLNKEPPPAIKKEFIEIANCIHNNTFQSEVSKGRPQNKKRRRRRTFF